MCELVYDLGGTQQVSRGAETRPVKRNAKKLMDSLLFPQAVLWVELEVSCRQPFKI
jgi:hypothetical protein